MVHVSVEYSPFWIVVGLAVSCARIPLDDSSDSSFTPLAGVETALPGFESLLLPLGAVGVLLSHAVKLIAANHNTANPTRFIGTLLVGPRPVIAHDATSRAGRAARFSEISAQPRQT
ncbi:MAG: hypothetical protein DMF84_16085 [Acidobacteria bacterium]|nr:MAG: hypothetical protein DMF84_16085 [Acidobacteriota bacterium]